MDLKLWVIIEKIVYLGQSTVTILKHQIKMHSITASKLGMCP